MLGTTLSLYGIKSQNKISKTIKYKKKRKERKLKNKQ